MYQSPPNNTFNGSEFWTNRTPSGSPPSSTQPNKPAPAPKRKISLPKILVLLIIIGLLGYLVFQLTGKKGPSSADLFSQAEMLYEKGDLVEALTLYQQIKLNFPDDPLIPVVERRIQEISVKLEEAKKSKEKLNTHIQELMAQANQAFAKKNYLKPANNNAIYYTEQILALDPHYQPALDLQEKIVEYYKAEAQKAEAAKQYDKAIEMYNNILRIRPDDSATLNALNIVLGLNQYYQTKKTSERIVNTERELQRLRRLLSEEQKKRAALEKKASTPPRTASSSNRTSSKSASTKSTGKTVVRKTPTPKKAVSSAPAPKTTPPPATTKPATSAKTTTPPATTTPKPAASSAAIPTVIEPLIDGGKRKYVFKKTPVVPATWNISKPEKVRAECTVGIDGRVEKVRVLNPASDKRLTQLAVEALKQYRYKPATRNGKPVRFKVVELIVFK